MTALGAAAVADDVRITSLRPLRGPNLWARTPVVIAELRVGALAVQSPRDVGEIAERVAPLVGGKEPLASWGTLLLALARMLQRRAGAPDPHGRVVASAPGDDRWTIVVGFDEEELAEDALDAAARIIRDLLRGDDPEIDETVATLVRTYRRARPDPTSLAVIEEARRRGIPVRRNAEDRTIQLGLGATRHDLGAAMAKLAEPQSRSSVPPLDRSSDIIASLYPPGAPSRIPVIATTGTNGKTTTTRLIAHLFREHGQRVGYTTTDGVYFQDALLLEGDLTGPFAANMILSHPEVDVAVLETARGGILRAGLGYDECDVAVVLNVTADHLGMRGIDTVEQLAEVKAVVPSVVRPDGYAVLNADDPLVAAMRERTPGQVAFFSMLPVGANPVVELHLAAGGIIARVEETDDGAEELVIRQGSQRLTLGPVADVPLSFGGHARFQIGNLLAAALAGFTQGVPLDTIRRGLMSFAPSASRTPGRLNVIETVRGRVLLDYAHNAAAIAGLLDFVRRLPANRRMALLGVPGDRRDADLREVGRLCAGLDLAVFKEHEDYRRGRPPGETARIMADGALSAGMPADRVRSFDDEAPAVAATLEMMQPGDVVALIADDADAVREQLRPFLRVVP